MNLDAMEIVAGGGELADEIVEEACTLCDEPVEESIIDVIVETGDPELIEATIEAFEEIEVLAESEDEAPEIDVDVVPLIVELEEAESVLGK